MVDGAKEGRVAEEIGDDAQRDIIPLLLVNDKKSIAQFSSGFAGKRIHEKGLEWALALPDKSWGPSSIATWALNMPFQPRTWDWVAANGSDVELQYWGRIGSWGFPALENSERERAIKQFITVKRPWSALDHLVLASFQNKARFSPDVICNVLEAIELSPIERTPGVMDAHNIQEAFKYLHESSEIDEARVARLEFAFLPFLDKHSHRLPKILHRQLARSPDFFVDCLKLLYNPRHASEKEKASPDSEKAAKAERIWHLLRDWHTIPGSNEQGVISVLELLTWVRSARQKAKEADRLEVCDLTLGELFARAREDEDKAMPPVAIRDVIEECESIELERGLRMGFHNLRGVYSKGLYEGGKQERELASRFQNYARICSKWPRTAAVLYSVAEDYLREASREDERAKARD